MPTTSRGGIFTFDLLLSFFLLQLMLFISLWEISRIAEKNTLENREKGLLFFAIYLADSLVKNHDGNWFSGIADFDKEKHRTKSNEIMVSGIKGLERNQNIFEAWTRDVNGKRVLFSKDSVGKNCVAVERIVIADSKKTAFGVKVCG